ncbi:MAG: alpha/beta hydrolase [Clostridia bacterium]|nr:alpha/beta hydrolase [Clostridia bacterium]
MKAYKVQLKEQYSFLQGGTLECILMENPFDASQHPEWKRPALIVVPGGAYSYASKREAQPVSNAFLGKGFQCFILDYLNKTEGVRYPEQFLELSCAVDFVKKNAEEMCVNANEIFVVGFSAGGHLTANLATLYAEASSLAGKELDNKPTAVGLSYPVISKEGHEGSFINLLDGYSDEEKAALEKKLTLNEAVSDATVPAFIWATATDNVVNATDSLKFATALAVRKIPYELHVFPKGHHGTSTGDYEVNGYQIPEELKKIRSWIDDCADFFHRFTEEKF